VTVCIAGFTIALVVVLNNMGNTPRTGTSTPAPSMTPVAAPIAAPTAPVEQEAQPVATSPAATPRRGDPQPDPPAQPVATSPAQTPPTESWRTWASADGRFTVEAKLTDLRDGQVHLTKQDGRTIKVDLTKLSEADREYCLKQPVAAGTNALPVTESKAADTDTRTRWLNESYGSTIYQVKGKEWAELDNATQKVKWTLTETARTAEYVELHNATRNQDWRLTAKQMDMKVGDEWKWLSRGHWDRPEAKPATAN